MNNPTRALLIALISLTLPKLLLAGVAVNVLSDMAVTKSGPDQAAAGADITYTIDVFNNGPDNSLKATLTDNVPSNTTFVSLTAPVGWNCTTIPAVGGTGAISCDKSSVPNGAHDTFTVVVNINSGTAPG